jgi:hypothetical protein
MDARDRSRLAANVRAEGRKCLLVVTQLVLRDQWKLGEVRSTGSIVSSDAQ